MNYLNASDMQFCYKKGHSTTVCTLIYKQIILFAIYTDGLLKRLQETGVGCHMGHRFSGALAYADDITLLSPSRSGMAILVKVCEKYAAEYDIIFNSKKSQLLHFRGSHCCTINKGIEINGQHVII